MTTSLDDLTTPMTADEARAAIYAALAARGVKTTGWKTGAVVRTIVYGLGVVASALSTLQATLARGGFLDLAEEDWLSLVALYVFGETRAAGTFAATTVTLTNSGGGVYSGAAGDLIVASSVNGKQYRSTEAYSLAALGTVNVAVEAIEVGEDSNAAAGDIDTVVTALNGVSVTNATGAVGTDEETDPVLRERCRAKWATLGTGSTEPAYDYWARTASSEVVRVTVRENDDLGTTTDGDVTVVLAAASAGVSATAVSDVDSYIQTKRPLCANVHVASATAFAVPVTAALTVRTGYGAAAVAEASSSLATYASSLRIGETVYRSAVIEVLMQPAGVVNAVLTVPTADVALSWDEIAAITDSLSYVEIP